MSTYNVDITKRLSLIIFHILPSFLCLLYRFSALSSTVLVKSCLKIILQGPFYHPHHHQPTAFYVHTVHPSRSLAV